MRNESRACDDFLMRRLNELDRHLPMFHANIANILFTHRTKHFAHEEIVCLVSLNYPSVAHRLIEDHLDDLVRWEVVQKIVVEPDRVFYDINTQPHLHIYCERKQELVDAPVEGVLRGSLQFAGHAMQ